MRGLGPLYNFLFFASGLAGLVYQVVWSRWLSEIFGVTVHAVTAVLVTFLGGLALGGVVLGRLADGRRRPLALFGALELLVAVTAVLGVVTYELLGPAHVALARRLLPDSPLLLLARIALAAVVILPPTFLMGGTLPAMTRAFTTSLGGLGRTLGTLYALNTAGAVAGTLLSGFVLIRAFGLTRTFACAVAVNVLVGATAVLLARRRGAPEAAPPIASPVGRAAPSAGGGVLSPIDRRALLGVMMASGFVSLGLEVLWTRALVLPLGTSSYAFVTMLAAFLIGIALGSALARTLVGRVANLRRLFGWVQLGIAASALLSLPVLGVLGAGAWEHVLEGGGVAWTGFVGARFGVSFLVMLVPTTLIGATFPLACAMWIGDPGRVGRGVGVVYGANTLGNIAGAAVTGFFLIAALGIQKSVAALVALNALAALWSFVPDARRRGIAAVEGALVGAGVLISVVLLATWTPQPFRAHGETPDDRTTYYREGIAATVKVLQKVGNARQRLMAVDGVKIGESYGGVDAKQQALAHFPFLLSSDHEIRRVLTIGLGTGILAGEVLRHGSVESLVCVEISPSVIEAAGHFAAWNDRVLENPRARIVNDDGVGYLRRSQEQFDAIISDAKSRAGHAANALFFSTDYYMLCREHLEPAGLLIQWLPLALPGEEFRTILRTFADVFPETYVWLGNDSCFLVGRERRLRMDLEHVARVMDSGVTDHLARYGWADSHAIASFLIADGASVGGLVDRERTRNTLDHPVLEFYSLREPVRMPEERRAGNIRDVLASRADPLPDVEWVGGDAGDLARNREAALRTLEAVAMLKEPGADVAAALDALRGAAALAPENGMVAEETARALFDVGLALQRQGRHGDAIEAYREAIEHRPDHALTHANLGAALGRTGSIEEGIHSMRRAVELNPGLAGAHEGLGQLLATAGRHEEATRAYATARRLLSASGATR